MGVAAAFKALDVAAREIRDSVSDALDGGASAGPPANLAEWAEQLSFVPAPDVQAAVAHRFATITRVYQSVFQKLDVDGVGPISLDHFRVTVTDPTIDGIKLSAAEMLRFEREHFGEIFNKEFASFAPYDPTVSLDQAFLGGDDYLGATLHIDIPAYKGTGSSVVTDDGTIAVVLAEEHRFRVCTIRTWRDWGHPVSGYRQWGVDEGPQGMTMYTRGTDRATGFVAGAFGKAADLTFKSAERVWRSWQSGLIAKIKEHGGDAVIGEEVSKRYRWGAPSGVRALYFKPSGTWQH